MHVLEQLANHVPQLSYAQALAGWATVWVALVTIPPGGHRKQENVIALNMAHGLIATALSALTIVTGIDTTFSTAASVAFFFVDALVMLDNGRRSQKNSTKGKNNGKDTSPGRWMDYLHHIMGAVGGTFLLFRQNSVCARSCPAPNLYTYAQTNEISTPFYGLYRLTRHPVAGAVFALFFFLSRIVFNMAYLVPYSFNHCSLPGFMVIAFPYQLLQVLWMFLIIKKVAGAFFRTSTSTNGGTNGGQK